MVNGSFTLCTQQRNKISIFQEKGNIFIDITSADIAVLYSRWPWDDTFPPPQTDLQMLT